MLRINQVTKSFGSKEIVHPINYTFGNGLYGLLGPNGAGKTTFINMLAAVSRPSSGSIVYAGKDIFKNNLSYYDALGFLPQQDAIYPNFKARIYLEYMAELKGLSKKESKQRIQELAELCNLTGELEKRCGRYSGGMKRRLGLMQALLNDPKVLILDEPTSGLDPMERIRLRNLITHLSQNRTVIFSTHIVPDIEQIANRIIFLNQGRIAAEGELESFTEPLAGILWELKIHERDMMAFSKAFRLISYRAEGQGSLVVRFVSHKQVPGAIPKRATLEDAFALEFGVPGITQGRKENGRHQ